MRGRCRIACAYDRGVVSITQVDAFTDILFEGNPASVVLLDGAADEPWMQALARETGLPATAFAHRLGDGVYGLRWFSPLTELALCGHGTLSTAHMLFERGDAGAAVLRFQTREAGELQARRNGELTELDFPSVPTEPVEVPSELVDALGAVPTHVERGRLDYLVELATDLDVQRITPDFQKLRGVDTRGVIVTARSQASGVDFVSRFFAPRVGNDEDFVTGSAHCALGPYWARRLGSDTLVGVQVSARRGTVHVRLNGPERVTLGGRAVTVSRGALTSDPVEAWHASQARLIAGFPRLIGVEPPLLSTAGPR